MAKTVPGALTTHLQQDVTAIASAWQITRLDGTVFRFTNGSRAVPLDFGDGTFTFSASEGFNRSNIANDSEMNVGNLEIVGLFDNAALKEDELRRGLFDFADVKIAFYNQQTPTDGIIKMLRGQLSEVQVTPKGFFNVELRDLTQVYSKQLGEYYSKDCRDDLGGLRCTVPILPSVVPRNTTLALGEFYIASPELALVSNAQVLVHGDNGAADTGTIGGTPTIGSQAAVQTVTTKFGPAAIELSPTGSVDPSNAFVSYPDVAGLTIGANAFTIEGYIRFKDLTDPNQVFASHYNNTGNQRAWHFSRAAGNIAFFASDDGTSVAPAVTKSEVFTPGWAIDTWYHIAVSRDASDDVRVFVDGVQYGTPTAMAFAIHNSTDPLRLGKFRSTGFDDNPLFGFIEDFRFTNGAALYTANFTAPARHVTISERIAQLIWEDYEDRLYEVTTGGVSDDIAQPSYDTVIGNTTTDGSAVLTARNSFMRFAEVTAVDGSSPRRKFTVTELTPNSGYTISDRTPSAMGFADDFFNFGQAFFETGNNTGKAKEVRDFTADDGITIEQVVELFEDLPFPVEVGDKLRIYPGCDKTHATCVAKFANAVNFVGEPYVPGADTLGTYPDARSR